MVWVNLLEMKNIKSRVPRVGKVTPHRFIPSAPWVQLHQDHLQYHVQEDGPRSIGLSHPGGRHQFQFKEKMGTYGKHGKGNQPNKDKAKSSTFCWQSL